MKMTPHFRHFGFDSKSDITTLVGGCLKNIYELLGMGQSETYLFRIDDNYRCQAVTARIRHFEQFLGFVLVERKDVDGNNHMWAVLTCGL
jgi:hypothetical protein